MRIVGAWDTGSTDGLLAWCIRLASIAETQTKTNLERKGFISSYYSLQGHTQSLREVRAETQGGNVKVETEVDKMVKCYLLTTPSELFSYTAQAHMYQPLWAGPAYINH